MNSFLNRISSTIRASLPAFMICTVAVAHGQSFFKSYAADPGVHLGAQCIHDTPDGHFVIGGNKGDSALVMKVDATGNVLWASCFKPVPGYRNLVYQLASTPDGFLVGTGNALFPSMNMGITFHFKMDISGVLIWQSATPQSPIIRTHDLIPIDHNHYMGMSGTYNMADYSGPDVFTTIIDAASGTLISYSPRIDHNPANHYIDDIHASILSPSGTIYSTGRIYMTGSSSGSMRAYITKFNQSGDFMWSKHLMFPSGHSARIYGTDIIHNNDSLTISYLGDISGASSNFSIGLIRCDTSGAVAWSRDYKFQGFSSAMSFGLLRMPYGYAITGYATTGGVKKLFVLATDHAGHSLWAQTYGNQGSIDQPYTKNSIALGNDIMFTGVENSPSGNKSILARVDVTGNIVCSMGTPLNVTTTNIPPFSTALTPNLIPHSFSMTSTTGSSSAFVPADACTMHQIDLGPSDTTVCSSISLGTTIPGATYTWSTGSQTAFIETTGPGTYWVQATLGCCIYSDTIQLLPGSLPTASFAVLGPQCGPTVDFANTSLGATGYFWDFGDGQTSTLSEPLHSYSAPGTYSISLTATNDCGSSDTIILVQIVPGDSITIQGPELLCSNENGNYFLSFSSGSISEILWSTGDTSSTIVFSSPTEAVLIATAEDTNGCVYADTLHLSINPAPTGGFNFNQSSCDPVVPFSDQSTNATAWSWNLGNGQSSADPSPIGHYSTLGTYTIQQIVSNPCGSDTTVQVFTHGPTGILSLNGPDSLCAGSVGFYSAHLQGIGIDSVTWSTGAVDPSLSLVLNSDTDLWVHVLGTDGCLYADSMTLSLNPSPSASFTAHINPCDTSVTFISTTLHADGHLWHFPDGTISTIPSPVVHFSELNLGQVMLLATNVCGADTAYQDLEFPPQDWLHLVGPTVICSDDPIALHLEFNGNLLHDIQWSTGDTTSQITMTPMDGEVVTVSALSAQGCELTSSYTMTIVGEEGYATGYIPNVFTPNNDGRNDRFAPVIINGFLSMSIFNRWGQEIFHTTRIDQPWRGDHAGKPVPDGTYVFIVKWNDLCRKVPMERIGHVTLLR